MYLHNKYSSIYYKIVNNARERILDSSSYTEKHHIIPKSLGGTNSKDNIVVLTAKEHFICHRLLTKMVEGEAKRKMVYAAYMMLRGKNRYVPCGRVYQFLKEQLALANKERPGPNLRKKLSDEWKKKIKDSFTDSRREQISNSRKGKATRPKGSFEVTDETRKKMSKARGSKGTRFGPHSEETKAKCREARAKQVFTEETYQKRSFAMKGRPKSEEHKQKISEAHKGRTISEETRSKISATLKARNIKSK